MLARQTLLATATLAAAILSTTALANEQISGSQLKDAVSGKRIYLATPFGGEFPLYYKTNGEVTGDGTALGLGKRLAPKETGRWFVRGDQLCQQFPTWYDGRISCFKLFKTGENKLRWTRDDGRSGRARIAS